MNWQLWKRRMMAASNLEDFKVIVYWLERLGPDAMSDDEATVENGNVVYRKISPRWRGRALGQWLALLDIVYFNLVANINRPGNRPHVRLQSNLTNASRKPVTRLPPSGYDETWKDMLSHGELLKLRISSSTFSFTTAAAQLE